MSKTDKITVGRYVHEQDTDKHHGRAMLIVKKVVPDEFKGKLLLKPLNASVLSFPVEDAKAADAALADPHEIDAGAISKDGLELWAEGKAVSGALRDTGGFLSVKEELEEDGDRVNVTVVKFSDLEAKIPSTPAVNGTSPSAHHPAYAVAGSTADNFDVDDAKKPAIVLVEDSIVALNPILLAVKVAPANVPVTWGVQRDTQSAPDGDHADIVALGGPPTITPDAAKPLEAKLVADGVGTFHVRPFVDCNGSSRFSYSFDIEPYLVMNLVLVRAEGVRNDSIAQPANAIVIPAAPTSTTGVQVRTGGWAIGTTGSYSKGTVKVIGGGGDGRRGLDRLFAGWCQHIGPTGTSASAPLGLDIYARYRRVPPAPPGALPVFNHAFFVFTSSGGAGTTFLPGNAPVVRTAPVLDCSDTATGGTGGETCTGQWGGSGSLTAIVKTNKPIGQEWTVDTLDSPSVGLPGAHPAFPGSRMVDFRFNIDFRTDLVFWTNVKSASGATGDPACNLYSSVQTNNWTVRFSTQFDHGTGAPVGGVPAVGIVMTKDGNTTRRATPVQGMNLETRTPPALNVFSLDATA